MGGQAQSTVTCTSGGSGGGGTGGGTLNDAILQQILSELQREFDGGQVTPFIDFFTVTTAGTFQQIYANSKKVRKAIIINLSSTDTMTITAFTGNAGAAFGASGKGVVLNPASTGGQAGGSLPVGNVDLSQFYITCSTNNSQVFAIYGET